MAIVKLTRARKAVLKAIGEDCNPLDADSIRKSLKDINKVTVYRALSYLESVGLIRRVDLHKDSIYYELTSSHHHHIICDNCGQIEGVDACISDSMFGDLIKYSKKFSSIKSHSLEFFGLCKACSKNL
jgi:Fe2+ or Zn2+ uptake regulation protein